MSKKEIANKEWLCPECGELNSYSMRLCRCGYLDENDTYSLSSKKGKFYEFNTETNFDAIGKVGKENKEQINSSFDSTKKIFDIAGKKRGYVFYVFLVFVAITFARGTVDGLIFFAILAMIFAKRIENYRKYGEPIIADKDTRQSIWKYGLSKTMVSLALPVYCQDEKYKLGSRMLGDCLLLMLVLHIYVIIVITFNHIAPSFLESFFALTYSSYLQYWPSYQTTAEKLLAHGYADRVLIVSHVYLVVALSCFVVVSSWVVYLAKRDNLEWFYINCTTNAIGAIRSLPIRFVFGLFMLPFALFVLLWIVQLPLYFPGDEHPRHGKYIWLYNYVYKDDLGLFYPIYMTPVVMTGVFAFALFVFEPIYKVCSRIYSLVK